MILLLWATAGILAITLLMQVVWTHRLIADLRRRETPADAVDELPRTLVILSLRGADPFLADCLRGLLMQDYPRYDVSIVIDSALDPANEVVRGVLAETGTTAEHVEVSLLTERLESCSLKVSALLQTLRDLDDSHQAVAWLDADVLPHRDWLHDMVQSLADPEVGVATGCRWFLPTRHNLGSLVRYVWSALAVLQMHAFQIAFGGSIIVRAEVFRRTELLQQWSRLMFEDVHLLAALEGTGWKMGFVPSAMMLNQESIGFVDCCRFIRRQLLNVRLYHPYWWKVSLFSWCTSLAVGMLVYAAVGNLFWQRPEVWWMLAAIVGVHSSGLSLLVVWTERHLRKIWDQRGERAAPASIWAPAVGIVTQLTYFGCMFSAAKLRRVVWRGIEYRIDGPCQIQRLNDEPYTHHEKIERLKHSV